MSPKPRSLTETVKPLTPEAIDEALALAKATHPVEYAAAISGLAYALLGPGWHADPDLVEDAPYSYSQDITHPETVNNLAVRK
jgi:hypothetical protein